MKNLHMIYCIALVLFASSCAQKDNASVNIDGIKKSVDQYIRAANAQDADAIAELMTEKTSWNDANTAILVGKEAIRKSHQSLFSLYRFEGDSSIADVRASGDWGVARGVWTSKLTPKSSELARVVDRGSFVVVLDRGRDGMWKWNSLIANSDQPLPGKTADGAEERTLVQVEKDWMQAMYKSDAAAFDKFIAKEWIMFEDGKATSRTQMLAGLKGGSYKTESMKIADLQPHIFENVAIVSSTVDMTGNYAGVAFSGLSRSIDLFVKRDGRWQAIRTQNSEIK
jgi:uncharacterized protein (TIGR02246 family)